MLITRVNGIGKMNPRSPLGGNEYFRGAGYGLPNGGPELMINSISTRGLR